MSTVEIYYCPGCRRTYRTDNQVGLSGTCEDCKVSLHRVTAADPAEIAAHIGVPPDAWQDLRTDE